MTVDPAKSTARPAVPMAVSVVTVASPSYV